MAKSRTIRDVNQGKDQPPSKTDDSLPRSFKKLQRNVANVRNSQIKSKTSKLKNNKTDLPVRKAGENFFQFVDRVNEIQCEKNRSTNIFPNAVSSSTKRYRERREERILQKKNRKKSDAATTCETGAAKLNEMAKAPPTISMVPKKKQTVASLASKAALPVSQEEQFQALILERRKDLERERMKQAYRQAKESRRQPGCSIDEIE